MLDLMIGQMMGYIPGW